MALDRILPNPNALTEPYWKAAREHRLALPRCAACGKFHAYPRSRCPFCSSSQLEWTNCNGSGSLYSYTEVFRAPSKSFADQVPYVVAIVELDEGPHLMSRIVAPEKDKLVIGARLTVEFDDADVDISLPVFRIAGS